MKVRSLLLSIGSLIAIYSCNSSKKLTVDKRPVIGHLRFVNEYVIPFDLNFNGTTVGGLSSIDYNPKKDEYYMTSDDRSDKNPARFYTAKIRISQKGIDTVVFTNVTTWKDRNGNSYPSRATDPLHTPDPESMRYDASRKQFIWSSEGERVVTPGKTVLEDPSVTVTDLNGKWIDSFALPSNMHMSAMEKGPRQNGVFEGTAFSDDHRYLFVSVEEPLYEDGPRAGSGDSTAWLRFIRFDTKTKKPIAQYAYRVDAVAYPANPPGSFKINGVSEIMYAGNDQFVVIERSFSTGREACTIRIYLADLKNATDVSGIESIPAHSEIKPVSKKLLLNMDDLGKYIDNVEGVTFGPALPGGQPTLLFIVDNNFDPKEKAQVFLFNIVP